MAANDGMTFRLAVAGGWGASYSWIVRLLGGASGRSARSPSGLRPREWVHPGPYLACRKGGYGRRSKL